MTDHELDAYIDAASGALNLPIDEYWRANVRANLAVSLKFGLLVDEFSLPDESEPASVFEA